MKSFKDLITEGAGLSKAATSSVRKFIKDRFGGKLTKRMSTSYDWDIGGEPDTAATIIEKSFAQVIDVKSKTVVNEDFKDGKYDWLVHYTGVPGSGINSITAWKYDTRTKTKIYFTFTDGDKPDNSGRFGDYNK